MTWLLHDSQFLGPNSPATLCSQALRWARSDIHKQVNTIAGQAVIQEPELMLLEMFTHLGGVCVAVAGQLKKEPPVMAPMRPIKDAAASWQAMRP
jgi:hypothetical protein